MSSASLSVMLPTGDRSWAFFVYRYRIFREFLTVLAACVGRFLCIPRIRVRRRARLIAASPSGSPTLVIAKQSRPSTGIGRQVLFSWRKASAVWWFLTPQNCPRFTSDFLRSFFRAVCKWQRGFAIRSVLRPENCAALLAAYCCARAGVESCSMPMVKRGSSGRRAAPARRMASACSVFPSDESFSTQARITCSSLASSGA